MSANLTLVIACHIDNDGTRSWTAAVVECVEDLLATSTKEDADFALDKAKKAFLRPGQAWFSSAQLARRFSSILDEDAAMRGAPLPEWMPSIEFGENHIARINKQGEPVRA